MKHLTWKVKMWFWEKSYRDFKEKNGLMRLDDETPHRPPDDQPDYPPYMPFGRGHTWSEGEMHAVPMPDYLK